MAKKIKVCYKGDTSPYHSRGEDLRYLTWLCKGLDKSCIDDIISLAEMYASEKEFELGILTKDLYDEETD